MIDESLKVRSGARTLSAYDWYSTFRGTALFIIAGLVANIGAVEAQLSEWNINNLTATLILWAIVELSRKFLKDYRKEPVQS